MSAVKAYSIGSLAHAYDGRTVLDVPRMDIPAGQICAVVGPNGCGKTTLLSILALLLPQASGSVLLFGEDAAGSRRAELRKKVTLVHQKPVLFSMSVRGNVAYGLHAAGVHAGEIRRRVSSMLEKMNLTGFADKAGRTLSGGEAQRAVLARALVLETPVLLLDEPTNSLDDASKPILRDLLARARRDRGATVVIATHDANFVSSLADRIVRMEEGKILEP